MESKNLTMFASLWMRFKLAFVKNGGWSSKKNIAYIFFFTWGLYTFIKEQGWLPKKSVRGKHIFITGAGSGLGRMMSQKFAKLGAKLTLADINVEGLEETKKMIKSETGTDLNVNIQKLDVSNRQNVTDLAIQCKEMFGDVDILVNNAGVVQGKAITEMNERFASKVMVINAESHFWLVKEFIEPMMKKNSGHVVSISSIAGIAGTPGMTDYCASKFAAYGFNEALRVEMKHLGKNITCTTICPFYFNTGMFDGVKTSLFYPLLDYKYVTWRSVTAILQNEEEVSIPWSMGVLIHLAKSLFPGPMVDYLAWLLVGYESMLGNFKGRQGDKNALNVSK